MITYDVLKAMGNGNNDIAIALHNDTCFLQSNDWWMVTQPEVWNKDFIDFLSKYPNETFNAEAAWAKHVDLSNNLFMPKSGGGMVQIKVTPSEYCRGIDHVPIRLITSFIEVLGISNTLTLYDRNVNYFKESAPFHEKGDINVKSFSANGTFPLFHFLEFKVPANKTKMSGNTTDYETRVLNIQGFVVKLALDLGMSVELLDLRNADKPSLKGLYYVLQNEKIIWIVKAEKFHQGSISKKYDSNGSTKLHPMETTWLSEKEAILKILRDKRVFNPLFQPGPDLNLSQKTKFWAGSNAHLGIESLKWKNWSDKEIENMIEQNRNRVETAFFNQEVVLGIRNLWEEINKETKNNTKSAPYRDVWYTKWREIVDLGEAFSKRGINTNLDQPTQNAFTEIATFMKQSSKFDRIPY